MCLGMVLVSFGGDRCVLMDCIAPLMFRFACFILWGPVNNLQIYCHIILLDLLLLLNNIWI